MNTLRRHWITKFSAVLVLSMVLILALDSFTVKNANNYPLSVGAGGSVGNSLNTAGDEWLFGFVVRNIGKTPITITQAALTSAENMTTLETSLRKVRDKQGLIGLARWPLNSNSDYPASDIPDLERIDADGAVIEPGKTYNLMIIVQSQADEAIAAGLKIEYRNALYMKYVQMSDGEYFLSSKGFENT